MNKVATELYATAQSDGVDLVAIIPQQGVWRYSIRRVFISNGPQTDTATGKLFRMYKGAKGTNEFSSTALTDNNDAQMVPPEEIPAGCDVFCVWQGQAAYPGTAVVRVITDGGVGY